MSGVGFYDTPQALAEYLLFHYGRPEQVLPWEFGPRDSLDFAVRCVRDCVDIGRVPEGARGLDLGCAVGRSSFEMARRCREVLGIDYSHRFVEVARHLQRNGAITFALVEEGHVLTPVTAVVPGELDRTRVKFEQGDAEDLRRDLGRFEVVLMANLVDRLKDPRKCLRRIGSLVSTGGQLVVTSPYTWLESYTPFDKWLGGYENQGRPVRTLDTLREELGSVFELAAVRDLPFLIREHARKYQWSVAQATTWIRRA